MGALEKDGRPFSPSARHCRYGSQLRNQRARTWFREDGRSRRQSRENPQVTSEEPLRLRIGADVVFRSCLSRREDAKDRVASPSKFPRSRCGAYGKYRVDTSNFSIARLTVAIQPSTRVRIACAKELRFAFTRHTKLGCRTRCASMVGPIADQSVAVGRKRPAVFTVTAGSIKRVLECCFGTTPKGHCFADHPLSHDEGGQAVQYKRGA